MTARIDSAYAQILHFSITQSKARNTYVKKRKLKITPIERKTHLNTTRLNSVEYRLRTLALRRAKVAFKSVVCHPKVKHFLKDTGLEKTRERVNEKNVRNLGIIDSKIAQFTYKSPTGVIKTMNEENNKVKSRNYGVLNGNQTKCSTQSETRQ